MRIPLIAAAAILALSLPLGGCITQAGRAAVGDVPPLQVGMQQSISCDDLVGEILRVSADVEQSQALGGVAPSDTVEGLRRENTQLLKERAQLRAVFAWCERREASQRVTIDLQAARRLGIGGLLPGISP